MADTSGVLARLQAALSVYDPTWDVGVGTATYKILEAVSQEIAYANNNSILQTYSYDINTKSGTELDAFCNLFGIYRQLGKRATGLVTFSIGSAATSIIDIPIGTQVAIPVGGSYTAAVYFATTAPAIINVGDFSQDVPVVAVLPGAFGNAPADTIITKISALMGVTSVNNNSAISGGSDPESDSALRGRWQSTVFSNTAGTYSKYILTASQDPNVTLANAFGQQNYFDENLQISGTLSNNTGTGGVQLNFVAYSGQTINNITYSGTTLVATSGIGTATTPGGLQASLNTMINNVYPSFVTNNGFTFLVSGTTTISNGSFTVGANMPLPYRLTMSGTTISGVTTSGGYTYYESVTSSNPDIGYPGTLSYNGTVSGYLFPQGNELVGSGLNTYSQITFANLTDYYYPTTPTTQLALTIGNSTNNQALFLGNTVEVISEYSPASSRSTAIASGNFVDVFINGTTSSSITEQMVFNPNFILSNGSSTNYLNTNNYILASGTLASSNTSTSGDIYVPLNQQPAINFPSQLSISSSGVADTVYLYNVATGSGLTYPIALNPYASTTFTATTSSGALIAGTTFLNVTNANSFLYPGMALASGAVVSGANYYISSTSTSGITLNTVLPVGASISGSVTGKAIVYPIYDNTNNQNSVLQSTGLVFDTSTPLTSWPALPTGNNISWLTYTHGYNSDVTTVESLTQQSRPLGVNTLVHQVNYVNLTINVNVVISTGYSQLTVESNIYNLLNAYFNNYTFLGTISFADINSQILSVGGISNCRTTSINVVALDGTTISTKTNDFMLASNQLPNLYNINFIIRGSSNF